MALAQDKHERALIPNCVSPQDIGVTYDMIGGLDEVKELLRQSITYPLKFPHLYNEGIAREAVKGVLLFGPPGTGGSMLSFIFFRFRQRFCAYLPICIQEKPC
jgi:ATP-dependent 26S proteasome regulatory subunit